MLSLIGSILLYHADATLDGWTTAIIVGVLLLAVIGLISLFRLGFKTVEPSLTPKQREGVGALPLLLIAVAIALVMGYFLASASGGQQ
jgi:nucleoside permease NupC